MPDPVLGDVAIGDVCLVSFFGTLASQRIINTFHYKATGVPTVPLVEDWWANYAGMATALAVGGALQPTFLACMCDEYQLDFVRIQRLLPTRTLFRDTLRNLAGTYADDPCPPNTAVSIERKGQIADRHSIGRVQLAGPPVGEVTAGLISGGYLAICDTFGANLKANITTAANVTMTPVLLGYTPGPVIVPVVTPVVAYKTYSAVRTMHRRTVGLGE
jgi:hypothetical protein